MNKKKAIKKSNTISSKKDESFSVHNKIYINYKTRLVLSSLFFIISFFLSTFSLRKALVLEKEKNINYTENSTLDYKVYLKDNNFYSDPYLEKNMIYVASLIDKIYINFDYTFNIDENIDLDFNYSIVGRLLIQDELKANTYFEKEYVLLDNKSFGMKNDNYYEIIEDIEVDYNQYNDISNSFKSSYGIDTTSSLIVYLKIDKNSNDDEFILNDSSIMSINIPLSEKSINIKMDYNEINENSKILRKSNIVVDNIIYVILSIIFIILAIFFLFRLFKLVKALKPKKSMYDKYVNKILKTYDRVIAQGYSIPNFKNYKIIKIRKFEELLDIRDNLKLPIIYYVVNKRLKCYFYIMHNDELYLLVVKAIDLEE